MFDSNSIFLWYYMILSKINRDFSFFVEKSCSYQHPEFQDLPYLRAEAPIWVEIKRDNWLKLILSTIDNDQQFENQL